MDELAQRLHPQAKIIFQDESVLCLDKPTGVLSHPSADDEIPISVLKARYDLKTETYHLQHHTLYLLHRLDKETSGCLLFAFKLKVAEQLKADFKQHKIQKEYLALVKGTLPHKTTWQDHLAKEKDKVYRRKGLTPNAFTQVTPYRKLPDYACSYLILQPKTGKTHQLRVQTASRNVPILGDRMYGDFEANKWAKTTLGISRMCLHARSLEFQHPKTKTKMKVISPLEHF